MTGAVEQAQDRVEKAPIQRVRGPRQAAWCALGPGASKPAAARSFSSVRCCRQARPEKARYCNGRRHLLLIDPSSQGRKREGTCAVGCLRMPSHRARAPGRRGGSPVAAESRTLHVVLGVKVHPSFVHARRMRLWREVRDPEARCAQTHEKQDGKRLAHTQAQTRAEPYPFRRRFPLATCCPCPVRSRYFE